MNGATHFDCDVANVDWLVSHGVQYIYIYVCIYQNILIIPYNVYCIYIYRSIIRKFLCPNVLIRLLGQPNIRQYPLIVGDMVGDTRNSIFSKTPNGMIGEHIPSGYVKHSY